MVANNRNEVWNRKCLEIQTYLGSKISLESWKFIKNIHSFNSGKNQINLISADVWDKYYYKLLAESVKKFWIQKKG